MRAAEFSSCSRGEDFPTDYTLEGSGRPNNECILLQTMLVPHTDAIHEGRCGKSQLQGCGEHFHDPAARRPSVVQDACSYGLALLGEERCPPESSYTSWGSLLG